MWRALLPIAMIILVLLGLFAFLKLMGQEKDRRRFKSPSFSRIRKEKQEIDRGELHRDPVSGTFVSESDAYVEEIDGKTYYFSSKENAERFRRGEKSD